MQEYRINSMIDRFVYRTVRPFLIASTAIMLGGYSCFAYDLIKKKEDFSAALDAGIIFGSTLVLTTSPLLGYYVMVRKKEANEKRNRENSSIDDVVQREIA